jgi:hypothetical protein
MELLRRNYDLVASVSTASVFLILDSPWLLWAVWGVVVTYQVGNRAVNG